MSDDRKLQIRMAVVAAAVPAAVFWLLFAVGQYPIMVPADHNSGIVRARESAAAGGFALCLLSLATIAFTSGVFGLETLPRSFVGVLLVPWLLASTLVFPSWQLGNYPIRFTACVVGIALLATGAAARRA